MLLKPWHWMRLQGHEMDREEDRGPCFQGTSTLGDWGEEEEPREKTEEGASSKLKGKGGVQYNESQMQRFKEANAMSVSNPAEQPNKRKKFLPLDTATLRSMVTLTRANLVERRDTIFTGQVQGWLRGKEVEAESINNSSKEFT